jgi:hypothetical protein
MNMLKECKLIEFYFNDNYQKNSNILNNDRYMVLMQGIIKIYNKELELLDE